jgi:hypothetical protein
VATLQATDETFGVRTEITAVGQTPVPGAPPTVDLDLFGTTARRSD